MVVVSERGTVYRQSGPAGYLEIALGSVTLSLTPPFEPERAGAQLGPGPWSIPTKGCGRRSFGEGLPAWVALCFQAGG